LNRYIFRLSDWQTFLYGAWHLIPGKLWNQFAADKMDRWKYLVLFETCAVYIIRSLLIVLYLNSCFSRYGEEYCLLLGIMNIEVETLPPHWERTWG
jgi:hypothetical protein